MAAGRLDAPALGSATVTPRSPLVAPFGMVTSRHSAVYWPGNELPGTAYVTGELPETVTLMLGSGPDPSARRNRTLGVAVGVAQVSVSDCAEPSEGSCGAIIVVLLANDIWAPVGAFSTRL